MSGKTLAQFEQETYCGHQGDSPHTTEGADGKRQLAEYFYVRYIDLRNGGMDDKRAWQYMKEEYEAVSSTSNAK